MDFFKSVFSEDPHPDPPDVSESPPSRQEINDSDPSPSPVPENSGGAWSFGGLIKNLATRSESVIQNYRRDFEELSSGLKKETAVIREVASRAVKDLPQSLEVGASVAQESLESVGQAIDDIGSTVWNSTAVIIAQGKGALSSPDSDSDLDYRSNKFSSSADHNLEGKKYSRFDMQLRNIQLDVSTYCEDPEDLNEYKKWEEMFSLDEKEVEIEGLMRENERVGEIYAKVVPDQAARESFWSRYYYKVHKLREAEAARAELVRRAISGNEEEDLSWDFDDDDEEEESKMSKLKVAEKEDSGRIALEGKGVGKVKVKIGEKSLSKESTDTALDNGSRIDRGLKTEVKSELKADNSDSCKDSDVSIVSTQPSMPEIEDLGWDEIEDVGSSDENKGESVSSSNRDELRNRLSAAETEEDLTWDIEEEDDEPIKS